MLNREALLGVAGLLLLGLSGCPMTDDYYIDARLPGASAGDTLAGGAGWGGSGNGGGGKLGPPMAGMVGMAGSMPRPMPGGSGVGGASMDAGGMDGSSGTCSPSTERCNGHDDNCNDVVDERACNDPANGTTGCAGFVIASRPDHGYMLCPTTPKTYEEAQQACQEQSMRLAWLETESENEEVSAKVHALTNDEVAFGATDIEHEGDWVWDGVGSFQFWRGDENGAAVDDQFAAWAQGTPNDDNGGEDCAVLNPATKYWGDRDCGAQYAYLCEEPE
jgi:hypothetical protein